MDWESLQLGDYGIYQDKALGKFTRDPIDLVHFLKAGPGEKGIDLCTGNGIIPLYANALYGCPFCGVDVDGAQLTLARLSAKRNNQPIPFYEMDAKDAPQALGHGAFDLVTMNPPYFPAAAAGENPQRARQRHGDELNALLEAAFGLLNNGGRLVMSYRASGLVELLLLLRHQRLEPKTLCLHPVGGRAKSVYVEAKKLAKPGMDIILLTGQDTTIT